MKTVVMSMFMLACVAGNAWSQNCAWPCNALYRCGATGVPETSTCAADDSCASVNGDDFTRMRFSVPEARLESRSEVSGVLLSSGVKVYDSIRAHGGSGAAVDLLFELDVTLERFEPEWSGVGPRPWAWGSAQIELPAFGGIGFVTVGFGSPGHQVHQKTLRMTRPIVPDGDPLVVEWSVGSSAGTGGKGSSIAQWRVSTNDPSVTLEHCRDLPVPARRTSWGAVKSIYRGASTQ